ncbi:MAG: hypothetical protein V1904_09165 [Bacteroidota bacterium]
MLKKLFFGIVIIFLAATIISCGGSGNTNNGDKKDTVKVVKKDSVKVNKKYTDIAQFISGMAVDEKSELYELSGTESFKNYSVQTDSSWAKLKRGRLAKMNSWSEKELTDLNKDLKTLFYPFSGPDFFHVHYFFPKAKKYIMFGLEPVGSIPEIKSMTSETLTPFFTSLNTSINDAVSMSFFKTIDMSKELTTSQIPGITPLLMLFIARTGHEIVDIKPWEFNADGIITPMDTFTNFKGKDSYDKGVEISFVEKGDTVLQKIYYFSADVSDAGLKDDTKAAKYFDKLDSNVVTMVKSASYLMHNDYFSTIRNYVLAKSKAFFQDDSGIPYRCIEQKKWNISLYGVYNGPIQLFAGKYEKDLKEAYTEGKDKVKPLDFHYGYGNACALLVARKK